MLKYQLPIRMIVAIITGILISKILSVITHWVLYLAGIFPALGKPIFEAKILWIALFYHSFYALVGAYFTAAIAEKKAKKAVFILGTKEAILWLLGTILLWHHAAPWYNITKAVLGIPLALLGGKIYAWRQSKKSKNGIAI